MTQIAIGIVLFPDLMMTDMAIRINQELTRHNPRTITLDKSVCLPHIPLCMGYIDEELIDKCGSILSIITKSFSSLALNSGLIQEMTISHGEILTSLPIEKTRELQALYDTVVYYFQEILSIVGSKEAFLDSEAIRDGGLAWISGYEWIFDGDVPFSPRINLGIGHTDLFAFPIKFTASQVAICHLGNYSTCQRVLASSYLSK